MRMLQARTPFQSIPNVQHKVKRRIALRAKGGRADVVNVSAAEGDGGLHNGPSTSDQQSYVWAFSLSRRHASLTAAALIATLCCGDTAHAAKTVTLRDGSQVSAFEHGMSLTIVALRGSVPAHWAVEFKTSVGRYCGFSIDQRQQLADIFKELSDTSGKNNRSAGIADVATLGDSWLGPAIQRGLVQPIAGPESYRWYRLLPPRMRQLVRRNTLGLPDPHGAVYGVPYRWGCTLIAYRRDRLLRRGGRPVLDWSDLLQPALRGRVAMLDSPRELVAVALRSLGLSASASAAELAAAGISEQTLQERVAAFRQQVKLFSSRDHVRALLAGDVWAVVGYSQDLVLMAERSGNMEVVAPLSGTQLWADVWVVPSGAKGGHRRLGPSPLLPVWFEFTLSPGRIAGQPSLKGGAPVGLLPKSDPATSSSSSGESSGAPTPIASLREHRRHLEALKAAEAADSRDPLGIASEKLVSLVRGLPLLRPFLNDPRVRGTHEQGHAGEGHSVGGDDRDGGEEGIMGPAAAAASALYPAVELHGENGYLPAPVVLDRSEFLLPVDEQTLGLYRRVLEA